MTIVCFDKHRKDRVVAAVRNGNVWHHAKKVKVFVPMETRYRGPNGRQPKFYLFTRRPVKVIRRKGVIELRAK